MSGKDELFIIDEAPDALAAQNELERMLELQRRGREDIEREEAEIESIARTYDGSAPSLPHVDFTGKVIPSEPEHTLKRRRELLAKAKEGFAVLGRNIEAKRKELAALQSTPPVLSRGPVKELQTLARIGAELAAQAQRKAEELGWLLRGMREAEQTMGALANTARARNMLSLASFKTRSSYALIAAAAFELDPDAPGPRGRNVFFALEGIDPTSSWRGLTLEEICDRHYAALIRETCHGG